MKKDNKQFNMVKVMRIVKNLSVLCLVWSLVAFVQFGPVLRDQIQNAESLAQRGYPMFMLITIVLFFALALTSLCFCVRLRHGYNEE